MVGAWVVSLELTRDDGGALDDKGLDDLNNALATAGMKPVLSRPDPGTVLAKVTVAARSGMEARCAARYHFPVGNLDLLERPQPSGEHRRAHPRDRSGFTATGEPHRLVVPGRGPLSRPVPIRHLLRPSRACGRHRIPSGRPAVRV